MSRQFSLGLGWGHCQAKNRCSISRSSRQVVYLAVGNFPPGGALKQVKGLATQRGSVARIAESIFSPMKVEH